MSLTVEFCPAVKLRQQTVGQLLSTLNICRCAKGSRYLLQQFGVKESLWRKLGFSTLSLSSSERFQLVSAMVKVTFTRGKITCLFCGIQLEEENLMGHISLSHLNYERYKCSECDFKSVHPDVILDHSIDSSHSNWIDDVDDNQFAMGLVTCVLKLSRFASSSQSVESTLKLVDQMIMIADGNPILKLKRETSDLAIQCSLTAEPTESDSPTSDSPELAKFLHSLMNLGSPTEDHIEPIDDEPSLEEEPQTSADCQPSTSSSTSPAKLPVWTRGMSMSLSTSTRISPTTTLTESVSDTESEAGSLQSYVRLIRETFDDAEVGEKSSKRRKMAAESTSTLPKKRRRKKAEWKSLLKNCQLCSQNLTSLSTKQLDIHVVKHMTDSMNVKIIFHSCPYCDAGTVQFDDYNFKRTHLDRFHPQMERICISHVDKYTEEIIRWANKCFFPQ